MLQPRPCSRPRCFCCCRSGPARDAFAPVGAAPAAMLSQPSYLTPASRASALPQSARACCCRSGPGRDALPAQLPATSIPRKSAPAGGGQAVAVVGVNCLDQAGRDIDFVGAAPAAMLSLLWQRARDAWPEAALAPACTFPDLSRASALPQGGGQAVAVVGVNRLDQAGRDIDFVGAAPAAMLSLLWQRARPGCQALRPAGGYRPVAPASAASAR